MDFFKKQLNLVKKSKEEAKMDPKENVVHVAEELKEGIMESNSKKGEKGGVLEEENDDEDDFITNEVKKRLKELRKNSFMVLIPEESCLEGEDGEEEEIETSSSEFREAEVEDDYCSCRFDTLYNNYFERMLFFDKMIVKNLEEAESWNISNQSSKYASKKLSLALKSLSFKTQYEILGGSKQIQLPISKDEPILNLEIAYVSQICLSWEALHCQYIQLIQQFSSQLQNPFTYSHAAQEFQQFQVLLLRFMENEPFEQGSRVDIYARSRSYLPKLLQVPRLQGSDQKENDSNDVDPPILAPQLLNLIEACISTFRCFLKRDKNDNSNSSSTLFKGHNHGVSSLNQVQSLLAKKQIRIKELSKKKVWKISWLATEIEGNLLFALIDIDIVKRVLRMANISKEQFLWCEEKLSRLELSDNKLCRSVSPVLFPY